MARKAKQKRVKLATEWIGVSNQCEGPVHLEDPEDCPAYGIQVWLLDNSVLQTSYQDSAYVLRSVGDLWLLPAWDAAGEAAASIMSWRWALEVQRVAYDQATGAIVRPYVNLFGEDWFERKWLRRHHRFVPNGGGATVTNSTTEGQFQWPSITYNVPARDVAVYNPGLIAIEVGTGGTVPLSNHCDECPEDGFDVTTASVNPNPTDMNWETVSQSAEVAFRRPQRLNLNWKGRVKLDENEELVWHVQWQNVITGMAPQPDDTYLWYDYRVLVGHP